MEMKPEQINVAIAEAFPGIAQQNEEGAWEWKGHTFYRPFTPYSDLNAVHEAELGLRRRSFDQQNGKLYKRWMDELEMVAGPIELYHATAPQRCEALLRTLSLWVE